MGLPYLGKPPRHRCGDPGDEIPFGCVFDGAQSLTHTPAAAGSATTFTISFWARRSMSVFSTVVCAQSAAGDVNASYSLCSRVSFGGDMLRGQFALDAAPAPTTWKYAQTTALFHDFAAWSHYQYVVETGAALAADRLRIYVDGVRQAVTGDFPALNAVEHIFNTARLHRIGRYGPEDVSYFSGLLADVVLLDGIAADPSAFGYVNRFGVWVPRRFPGIGQGAAAYGAQGWHLDFADPLALGHDVSGNGNHWTPINLTAASQVTDTPTNTFAILDAGRNNVPRANGALVNLSDGGLGTAAVDSSDGSSANSRVPTRAATSGKVYWEHTCLAIEPNGIKYPFYNIINALNAVTSITIAGISPNTYALVAGDTIRYAVDISSGKLWAGINGDWVGGGNPETGTNPYASFTPGTPVMPDVWEFGSSAMGMVPLSKSRTNFGQRAFAFAIPAGYGSICTRDMPCPPIKRPDHYHTVRVRSAAGGVADLPWSPLSIGTVVLSRRLDAAADWRLNVSTRPGRAVATNTTAGDFAEADGLTWTASGYTIGAAAAYAGTRQDLIWRACPAAGLDIVTVDHITGTATTLAHAAGGIIDYAWAINVSTGAIKRVYHRQTSTGYYQPLNGQTNGTDAGWFASTAVDVTLGAGLPSGTYLLLLWRAVDQFSAFIQYVGIANSDGPKATLNFLPRTAIIKGYSGFDMLAITTARNPTNTATSLYTAINQASAEQTAAIADLLSNGVKIISTNGAVNTAGQGHMLAAWAAVPGKFARAR